MPWLPMVISIWFRRTSQPESRETTLTTRFLGVDEKLHLVGARQTSFMKRGVIISLPGFHGVSRDKEQKAQETKKVEITCPR